MAARRSSGRVSKAQREFVSEAEELLERMRSDLLDLSERHDSGQEIDPEGLNRLFRSAHSLKGLSGMFGLEGMSDLAHHLETLLDRLRLGQLDFDGEVAGLFDAGIEQMAAGLAALGDAEAQAALEAPTAALLQQIEAWSPRVELPSELQGVDLDDDVLGALTEYEEHRLRENLRRGRRIYTIEVSYPMLSFDASLAELSEGIRAVGELLSTLPSPGEAASSEIRFSLLTATELSESELLQALELPPEALRPVSVAEPAPLAPDAPRSSPAPTAPEHPSESDSLKSIGETVRVDIRKLDELMNLVGELVIQRRSLAAISHRLQRNPATARLGADLEKVHQGLERKLQELQAGVLDVRMVPLRQVFEKLSRVARRLRRELHKEVRLELRGADTELDKLIVEELVDPMMHVVRNAFDHAIETPEERVAAGKEAEGCIRIEATQRGNDVLITLSDDGRGIDAEAVYRRAVEAGFVDADTPLSDKEKLDLVFTPGLTTRDEVTETSGRGVGMDVLRSNLTALGGLVDIESRPGEGTVITLTLPITLAIIQALIVGVSDQRFAIPLNSVHEILHLSEQELQRSHGRELLNLRGSALLLRRLAREFDLPEGLAAEAPSVVVLGMGEARLGLVVERLEGQQDAVIKPMQGPVSDVRGIAGATDLGDGGAVLVLDVAALVEDGLRAREAA